MEAHLESFSHWLRDLASDAQALGEVAEGTTLERSARGLVIAGLNYLFKSLDLVPDGVDDIGYLDDAFVFRVAAAKAVEQLEDGQAAPDALSRIAEGDGRVREFLDEDYARLARYVDSLRQGVARGRSVDDVLDDSQKWAEFKEELSEFAQTYRPPEFAAEEKSLIKLRAFFDAKLPK